MTEARFKIYHPEGINYDNWTKAHNLDAKIEGNLLLVKGAEEDVARFEIEYGVDRL